VTSEPINVRRLVSILAVVFLAGCASRPSVPPAATSPSPVVQPPDVGGGIGSELGNYGMRLSGEATGPEGQHCVIYNWDRPLNGSYAIRYSSMSCDLPGKEWKKATSYTRSVIPLSQSNVDSVEHTEDKKAGNRDSAPRR
jgi:hypothetical protein